MSWDTWTVTFEDGSKCDFRAENQWDADTQIKQYERRCKTTAVDIERHSQFPLD